MGVAAELASLCFDSCSRLEHWPSPWPLFTLFHIELLCIPFQALLRPPSQTRPAPFQTTRQELQCRREPHRTALASETCKQTRFQTEREAENWDMGGKDTLASLDPQHGA